MPRGLGIGLGRSRRDRHGQLAAGGNAVSKAGFDKTDFTAMISRKSGVNFDGRYGDAAAGTPQAGIAWQPYDFDQLGLIKHFQYPDDTFNTTTVPFSLSAYGSPSDLWGRMTVALDYRGQPYYYKPNLTNTTYATPNMWQGETLNSPYDLNFSRDVCNPGTSYQAQTADNPFTVYELERLLRRQDIDSQELPQRLWQLSGIANKNNTPQVQLQLPRELTTDSWDPPVPSTTYPPKVRQAVAALAPAERYSAHHITEMLTGLMLSNTYNPSGSMTNTKVNAAIRDLLPEDLIAGLRMNINRPFGFGRDADGNGIVDEPTISELKGTVNQGAWWTMGSMYSNLGQAYSNYKTAFLNLTNGMNVTGPKANDQNRRRVNANEELMSRQLMARYLYVLARLFITDDFLTSSNNHWFDNDPFDSSIKGNPAKMYKASVRRIAQWAINVVDFMDADSIMTPFEYDLYPFSTTDLATGAQKDSTNSGRTWCVDGIIDDGSGNVSADDTKSWRGLVWGCERPELLITETLAFHDRRTEDTDKEKVDPTRMGQPAKTTDMTPDPDFDQRLMPRSGFFLELYNPWADNVPFHSGEFYSNVANSNTSNSGVVLNKMSGGAKPSPIWRLLVVKNDTSNPLSVKVYDPDNPDIVMPANLIDRAVYFANVNAATQTIDPSGTVYFSDLPVAPLMPGRYAVVGGSGDDTAPAGVYETTFGRRSDATEGSRASLKTDLTRRIILQPSANPNQVDQVIIKNNRNPGADDSPKPPDIQQPIAVVINKPRSLSLTEPKSGYPTTAAGARSV